MTDTTFIVIGQPYYNLPPNPQGCNIALVGGFYASHNTVCFGNVEYTTGSRGYIEGRAYHNFQGEQLTVSCLEQGSFRQVEIKSTDDDGYYRFDNLKVGMEYVVLVFSTASPDRGTSTLIKHPTSY